MLEPEVSRPFYPEGTDLYMRGGVWTFDSWVKKQQTCIKRVVGRSIREDWPSDLGAIIHDTFAKEEVAAAAAAAAAGGDEEGGDAAGAGDAGGATAAGGDASASSSSTNEYNVNESYMKKFLGDECAKLRGLLGRVNLEMSDALLDLVQASLEEYVAMVVAAASSAVTVNGKDDVAVALP